MNNPLISYDGKRSTKTTWTEFDIVRQSMDVSYWKRTEHKNGTETILILGYVKGRRVRLTATYDI
ncbi:hypothetical protein [Rhodococcus phage REQ1]|uniref:hypothetical protein n=1 Tax=Rhodococcus phage REQ1 TaxID=1109712 RepID=UPI00023EEBF6|nr:hypothetical protein RoPhREQ1_gp21 [Rhodococcus phage REQ1]AEV52017.1 hypothetical protein [Rhodococcus phage REQ1]